VGTVGKGFQWSGNQICWVGCRVASAVSWGYDKALDGLLAIYRPLWKGFSWTTERTTWCLSFVANKIISPVFRRASNIFSTFVIAPLGKAINWLSLKIMTLLTHMFDFIVYLGRIVHRFLLLPVSRILAWSGTQVGKFLVYPVAKHVSWAFKSFIETRVIKFLRFHVSYFFLNRYLSFIRGSAHLLIDVSPVVSRTYAPSTATMLKNTNFSVYLQNRMGWPVACQLMIAGEEAGTFHLDANSSVWLEHPAKNSFQFKFQDRCTVTAVFKRYLTKHQKEVQLKQLMKKAQGSQQSSQSGPIGMPQKEIAELQSQLKNLQEAQGGMGVVSSQTLIERNDTFLDEINITRAQVELLPFQ